MLQSKPLLSFNRVVMSTLDSSVSLFPLSQHDHLTNIRNHLIFHSCTGSKQICPASKCWAWGTTGSTQWFNSFRFNSLSKKVQQQGNSRQRQITSQKNGNSLIDFVIRVSRTQQTTVYIAPRPTCQILWHFLISFLTQIDNLDTFTQT